METLGNNMICNILPTPIYITSYTANNKQKFIDIALNLSKGISNYNGYYSHNQLHKLSDFKKFCEDIETHVWNYLRELNYKTKDGSIGRFKFSRMWITNFHNGNNVMIHNHSGQGGSISGVYYIELPNEEEQGLRFYHKEPPFRENIPFETDFTDIVNIGNDTLVLFPSEILHSGLLCNSKNNRINISFDIVYNDNLYGPIID